MCRTWHKCSVMCRIYNVSVGLYVGYGKSDGLGLTVVSLGVGYDITVEFGADVDAS